MKILFDPVYTQRPRICSTSYLVWELIEELMAWRDDIYFYVTAPLDTCEPEDLEFLNRYPERVTLLNVPSIVTNRLSELYMVRPQLQEFLHPLNKHAWDADVVVSSRIPTLKHMRMHSSRQVGNHDIVTYRGFVGLEEMPCLPFRDTVAYFNYAHPDTLSTYGLTEATLINNQWTKAALRPVLRELFSPAWQKRITERLHEVVPVKLTRFNMRDGVYEGGDFNVAFVGRMTGTRNFQAVAEVFRKQFSYPIGKNKDSIKFNISTNSQGSGAGHMGEVDFIDIQQNDRPKFHEFLKHQHVAVNLTTVEDFSLSTYETLMAGVPIIVHDHPWNQFLGKDYPFRCTGETGAYAMLNAFASDYSGMYAKFLKWENTTWAAYIADPEKNVTTGEKLVEVLTGFETRRAEFSANHAKALEETMSQMEGDTIDLTEMAFGNLIDRADVMRLSIGRIPSTLLWKLVATRLGFKDTNVCGVMRRG